MKEKSLESRRVRTHPPRQILSIGPVLCSAWLIEVMESWLMLKKPNLNAQRSTLNVQYSTAARLLYNDRWAEHAAYATASNIDVSESANDPQLPFARAHYHFDATIGALFLY